MGFVPAEAEWPSVYVHKELNFLLVVYVDDFKMSGPKGNLKKGRGLLCTKLEIEPETSLGLYLGCNQIKGATKLGGVQVNTVTYDMEEVLAMFVQKYRDITGNHVKLKDAKTPSPSEDLKDHPARRPYTFGKRVECTWCKHTFNPDVPFIPGGTGETDAQPLVQGELAPHAASVLMKLLYAARVARFVLLPLARHVTKWSKEDDKRLDVLRQLVQTKEAGRLGW